MHIHILYIHVHKEVVYFDFKVLLSHRKCGRMRCIMGTIEKQWANIHEK